jgi:DNA helicase-2/ATP-dependent DNA helicase PcrA
LAYRILLRAKQLPYAGDPVILDKWETHNILEKEYQVFYDKAFAPQKITLDRCTKLKEFYEANLNSTDSIHILFTQPENPITDEELSQFTAYYQRITTAYSCILPGEVVKACLERILSNQINPIQLLSISHLIVDEYQDLNPVDIQFVDYFANNGVHVFICGDDDQSIYSFRYGSPIGIQTFDQRHSNQTTYNLSYCFRCTPNILQSSQTLIHRYHDALRIRKELTSVYQESTPFNPGSVFRYNFQTDTTEASFIASFCEQAKNAQFPLSEIMILLTKPSIQSDLITESLEANQVEYFSPSEEEFLDCELGRFVYGLLRMVTNRNDYIAYRLLFGMTPGISVSSCYELVDVIIQNNLNYLDVFRKNTTEFFNSRITKGINSVNSIWNLVREWSGDNPLRIRIEDIDSIISTSKKYEDYKDIWERLIMNLPEDMTIRELLEYISAPHAERKHYVLTEVNQRLGLENQTANKVKIMSMHGAKGLDARIVFIPGLETGILPNEEAISNAGKLNEAARLLYVSITRGKGLCYLSHTKSRMVHGKRKNTIDSPFITYLNGRFVDHNGICSQQEYDQIIPIITNLIG